MNFSRSFTFADRTSLGRRLVLLLFFNKHKFTLSVCFVYVVRHLKSVANFFHTAITFLHSFYHNNDNNYNDEKLVLLIFYN